MMYKSAEDLRSIYERAGFLKEAGPQVQLSTSSMNSPGPKARGPGVQVRQTSSARPVIKMPAPPSQGPPPVARPKIKMPAPPRQLPVHVPRAAPEPVTVLAKAPPPAARPNPMKKGLFRAGNIGKAVAATAALYGAKKLYDRATGGQRKAASISERLRG